MSDDRRRTTSPIEWGDQQVWQGAGGTWSWALAPNQFCDRPRFGGDGHPDEESARAVQQHLRRFLDTDAGATFIAEQPDRCGDHEYAVEPPRPGRPPDPPSPVCSKEPGHTGAHRGRGSGGRGYVEWPNRLTDQPLPTPPEDTDA